MILLNNLHQGNGIANLYRLLSNFQGMPLVELISTLINSDDATSTR